MTKPRIVYASDMEKTAPKNWVRVAAYQMDIRLGDLHKNQEACIQGMELAAETGAKVLIFPECTLTGYAFPGPEEIKAHAPKGDEDLEPLLSACRRLDMSIIVGFLEYRNEALLNTVVTLSPEGVGPRYHKTHLPHLGADRWVCPGTAAYKPHDVQGIQTGLLICYDASFPEASRTLALKGAELIALPTNWPSQAIYKAEWLPNTRAYENVVYFIAVNRVGVESGFSFLGLSRICSPKGLTLVQGPSGQEALLVADINPEEARQKKIVRGEDYWVDRIGDRREDLYELEVGTQ